MRTRLLLIPLLFAACSGSTSALQVSKNVDESGGVVGTSTTSVQIPAGALVKPVRVTIHAVDAPAPAGTIAVGPAFNFGPDGQQFSVPVVISLPFDPRKLPVGTTASDIVIYTAPLGSTSYTALPTTVNGATVQTETTHFTVYLPAVLAPVQSVDMAHAPDLAPPRPDLATVPDQASAPDLTSANCVPTCGPTSGGCGCTDTCNGHTYTMGCDGTTTINCYCEIDGATQSQTFTVPNCEVSNIEGSLFSQCHAPS